MFALKLAAVALVVMVAVAGGISPPGASAEGVPSPAHSSFPADLGVLPLGAAVTPTITVRDSTGTPLAGVLVSLWALVDLGGGPQPLLIASNQPGAGFFEVQDNGDGTYTPQIIAGSVGQQSISAYIGLANDPAMLVGTATALILAPGGIPFGENSSVEISNPDPDIGEVVTLTLTLRDAEGNPVLGAEPHSQLAVILRVGDDQTLLDLPPFTEEGNGVYTLQATPPMAGDYEISFVVPYEGAPGDVLGTLTFNSIHPAAGVAFGQTSSVSVSNPAPFFDETVTFTLTLRDWQGTPVVGATPHTQVTVARDQGGTLTTLDLPAWTEQGDGVYTLDYAIDTVGQYQVTFFVPYPAQGDVIGSLPFNIATPPHGPLAEFVLLGYNNSAIPGAPFTFQVMGVDENGFTTNSGLHELTGEYDVVVDISGVTTGGQGLGPVTLTFLEGIAQHTVRFPAVGDDLVITVTSADDPGITGSADGIDAAFGDPVGSTSTIEAPETSPQVGQPMVFTVTLRDEGGNPIPGHVGSISIYLNDEGESQHAPVDIGGGAYTWTYVPTTPGDFFIAAYIGANHGIHEGMGIPIGIADASAYPGPVAAFDVVAAPGGGPLEDQQAGVPFSVRVLARDADGFLVSTGPNAVSGAHTADVTLAGDGAAQGTGAVTLAFTGGFATHAITPSAVQADTTVQVTSTEDATDGVTGTSAVFDVAPGPLASFTIEVDAGAGWASPAGLVTAAGDPLEVRLTARDTLGHVLDRGPHEFNGSATLSSNAAGTASQGLGVSPAFTDGVLVLDGAPHARIRLTAPSLAATLTAQSGAVTSTSAAFTVQAGPAAAEASSIHASGGAYTGQEVLVTVTLRDQFGNARAQGGDPVVLAVSDSGVLVTPLDAGNGTYTALLSRQDAVTVVVQAYLGADTTGALIGQTTISFSEPPAEEGIPPQEGNGEVTIVPEPGNVDVLVRNATRTPVVTGTATQSSATSPKGSTVKVTVPAGADTSSPPAGGGGLRLEVGLVEDTAAVSQQAPRPSSTRFVVGEFTARLVDDSGRTHRASFTQPVTLEFTFPTSDLPPGVSLDDLVLVYWDGEGWLEVPASASLMGDTITMSAQVLHFSLFSVVAADSGWGTFDPSVRSPGLTLTRWLGGGFARLDAALGTDVLWLSAGGRFTVYSPLAPAFVNAQFRALFENGVPAGRAGIVRR